MPAEINDTTQDAATDRPTNAAPAAAAAGDLPPATGGDPDDFVALLALRDRINARMQALASVSGRVSPEQTEQDRMIERVLLAAEAAVCNERAGRMVAFPPVVAIPWICDDKLDPEHYGTQIGTEYRAGADVEITIEQKRPKRPWATPIRIGDQSINLIDLLPRLPGLLAALADERVQAGLARDGWRVPPALLPVLALVRGDRGDPPAWVALEQPRDQAA